MRDRSKCARYAVGVGPTWAAMCLRSESALPAEMHEALVKPGHPFVVDYSETEKALGVAATVVDEVLREVV
ncbi:hypothetical protein AA958_21135 [Streptomyces sp. CNQ-509]|uniref:hypothetical protein n=1 Tax=Streptomyces sp. CNQ-509 TaxID=444103 RepID=UPI00062DFE36|nr:hypothetical protein [Streptomyces sp. CNQ-509]AKH84280.1 hypothetical protein AA958_21135 [Streptomyces sp. CNQ-509]